MRARSLVGLTVRRSLDARVGSIRTPSTFVARGQGSLDMFWPAYLPGVLDYKFSW